MLFPPCTPGTGHILINGGAALLIKEGERVTIMAFAISHERVLSRRIVLNEKNERVRELDPM